LRQTKILENFYRFSDEQTALGKFLRTMFYRTEGVEFEPTKRPDKITKYLGPFAVGVLAAYISSRSQKHTVSTITALIKEDPYLTVAIDKQLKEYEAIKSLRDGALNIFEQCKYEIGALNEEVKRKKELVKSYSVRRDRLYDTIVNNAPLELKIEIRSFLALSSSDLASKPAAGSSRDQIAAHYRELAQKKQARTSQKLALFNTALENASPDLRAEYQDTVAILAQIKELEEQLPAKTAQIRRQAACRIQEAWKNAPVERSFITQHVKALNAGRYLDSYFNTLVQSVDPSKALSEDLPGLIQLSRELASGSIPDTEKRLAGGALIAILSSRLRCDDDLLEYFRGINAVDSRLLSRAGHQALESGRTTLERSTGPLEQRGLACFYTARIASPVPPIAATRFANYRLAGQSYCFPDCGESTVRNFFNLFLYDPVEQIYDWRRLLNSGLDVDDRLTQFYQRNPRVSDTCSQRAHDEWAELISSLGGNIQYILPFDKPVCEIQPGSENTMRVLRSLTGIGDMQQIATKLMTAGSQVRAVDTSHFIEDGADLEDFKNKVIFHYDAVVVEWHFLKRHYRMYEKFAGDRASSQGDLANLELMNLELCPADAVTAGGALLRKYPPKRITEAPWFSRLKAHEALHVLLSARVDWMEDLEALAILGLTHHGIRTTPSCLAYISNIVLSIPSSDGYQALRDSLAERIENSGIEILRPTATLLRERKPQNTFSQRKD
jgi:hypothetical protein